jgi:hypothetical protein
MRSLPSRVIANLFMEKLQLRALQIHYICSMFLVWPHQLHLLDKKQLTSKCQLQDKETGGVNLPFLAIDTR